MTNAYCDLATLKSPGALNISGSVYDQRLLSLLEEASRWIDDYCNRHFFALEATRQFEASRWSAGLQQLLVPDLISVASVRVAAKEEEGNAQEDGHGWRTATYRLYPLDAAPDQPWGRPYTRLAIERPLERPIEQQGLSRLCRNDGHALVEVAGRWGYRQVTEERGVSIATGAELGPGDTTMTVTAVAAGTAFAAGQTLAVEQEQVYVTAVDGQQVTVERSINGSKATGHSPATAIGVYRYPGPVAEACLQLAAGWWQSGQRTEKPAGPGPEVEGLLAAYRKLAV